jgi:capsular polysaccharide biosynthesis protein
MNPFFSSLSVIDLLYKWRIALASITLIGGALGAIFSGKNFITPQYKSEAVVYPANIRPYSDETETEQMLQIMEAQDIVDSMILQYDLYRYYEIDSTYAYKQSALLNTYWQHVRIQKTPYDAVSIVVTDKNPQRAADMANRILLLYDRKMAQLHKSKTAEVIEMHETQMNKKLGQIDSLQRRLRILGNQYGLINYNAQSEEVMKGYLRTIYGNNGSNINNKAVAELKSNMQNHGGELLTTQQLLEDEARTFVNSKIEYENIQRIHNSRFTYSNIVSRAFPADKKSYPVRWLIVVFSSLSAFLFAVVMMLVLEGGQVAQRHNV